MLQNKNLDKCRYILHYRLQNRNYYNLTNSLSIHFQLMNRYSYHCSHHYNY